MSSLGEFAYMVLVKNRLLECGSEVDIVQCSCGRQHNAPSSDQTKRHQKEHKKNTKKTQKKHKKNTKKTTNNYDEKAAYDSYMKPEPGFQSGPGDSVDAN